MDPSSESIAAWQIWTLVALVAGSFFFAGTETALTSLGEAKARQLRDRLGRRGRVLGLWIHHPQKVLTTLLIGNNLVNIAASAMATAVALMRFGSAAVAVVTGVLTLVIVVLGEIIPKTLARENAEAVAVTVLWILRPFYILIFPLSWLLVQMTGAISRAMGGGKRAPPVTSEDIDYLIGLGSEVGALEGVKRELLNSVLEFTDLHAKEILVPRTQMVSLEAGAGFDEVLDLVEETEHSRIPVFEGTVDNIVGVLHVKDLLHGLRHGEISAEHFELKAWVRAPFFVPEVMKVSRLMKEMQRRRTHLAVVVDEFGGTSGIVTLEDVVEEIVGEIQDEHDVAAHPVKTLPDGKLLVDAGLPLRELEEVLEVEFPDDGDYETLGGFLTATAGQVPPKGSLVAYGGYTFSVREADEKRVRSVEVSRAPGRSEDGPRDGDAGDGGSRRTGEAKVASAGGAGDGSAEPQSTAQFFVKATS